MNERGLLNQIINNMRMNQQQGAFGNVSNNEMSMFSGNPMNGAVAGGAFGNVTDNESALLNMVAGGISNPMPRINEMRNNLATAGNVNNFSAAEAAGFAANNPNYEAEMFRGRSKQEIAQIRQAQKNLAVLKKTGQSRILTDGEKYQASQAQRYLESISSPVEVMPPDIDDLDLSKEALRNLIEVVESPNFRGFPIRGGR